MTPHVLAGVLTRINEADRVDAPTTPLVVPSLADGAGASITGRKPVATPLPGQLLVMLDAWLANAHKAEEPL